MVDQMNYTLMEGDFFLPSALTPDTGSRYSVQLPAGWETGSESVWSYYSPLGFDWPEQGWKIHVSSRIADVEKVFGIAAGICSASGIPFKHIAAKNFYLLLSHKHGSRVQAGKCFVAYPASESAAKPLLDELAEALAGFVGPYVLTDRRYGDSRTVYYRYGAIKPRFRLLGDGSKQWLIRDAQGVDVEDRRLPFFTLPAGIEDPFAPPQDSPQDDGPPTVGGFQIVKAVQHSNAGGTYQAIHPATGKTVILKEARPGTGVSWDGVEAQERLHREYRTLQDISARAPGLCPEPYDLFSEWEHEFLAEELVDGVGLTRWIATNCPIIQANRSTDDFAEYYRRCERILADLGAALDRLHALGYVFSDVAPGNILVRDDDTVRLIDFETAHRVGETVPLLGTDGYAPPPESDDGDPYLRDHYGLSAVALALLFPFHQVAGRSPRNLQLLHNALSERAPVPPALWHRAIRYHELGAPAARPTVDELLASVADGLLADADAGRPEWMFPPPSRAYETNFLSAAHGSAGILHALHHARVRIPDAIEQRFLAEVDKQHTALPPGLHAGTAGIAWVLDELGHTERSLSLLKFSAAHPLTQDGDDLGNGAAGVGLALLAVHRSTGEDRLLDIAALLGERIVTEPKRTKAAPGLAKGLAGISYFLFHLARATGNDRYHDAGSRLLRAELERTVRLPDGSLSVCDDPARPRALPYLADGSAGIGMALTRYASLESGADLRPVLDGILADATKKVTIQAGLHQGLAGLVVFRADHARWAGSPADDITARQLADGLAMHAIPYERGGVRILGHGLSRFSADLATGSAGVLAALSRLAFGGDGQGFVLNP
ncbi:serine/threonine protein kinase [Kitasatospora sp. GP30]|nr:serine/threonine protein kinase [Kitasatospora sp. GP30]